MKNAHSFTEEMLDFISKSPTPYHAVHEIEKELKEHSFKGLKDKESWGELKAGNYFVKKEGSLVAFTIPSDGVEKGFKMFGAHTDSPCLKARPIPDKNAAGFWQLGVEIYGGVTLSTWFDRDLGLAGKVFYINDQGDLNEALVDFNESIGYLPNLAIHLNRQINENRTINKQKEMPPVLGTSKKLKDIGTNGLDDVLMGLLKEKYKITNVKKIFSHDLRFYDRMKPSFVGLYNEFIAGARLDNLVSCFIGLKSLIKANEENSKVPKIVAFYDHEEVGSASTTGASGPFLKSVLERILGSNGEVYRIMAKSFLVSADNAHGIHPNYQEMHDEGHAPMINEGPVIKINANQRYATTFETEGIYKYHAEKALAPCQSFTIRADKPCGSTIGPLTAQELGVPTVDVGVPSFGMHSIREMAGTEDAYYLFLTTVSLFTSEK